MPRASERSDARGRAAGEETRRPTMRVHRAGRDGCALVISALRQRLDHPDVVHEQPTAAGQGEASCGRKFPSSRGRSGDALAAGFVCFASARLGARGRKTGGMVRAVGAAAKPPRVARVLPRGTVSRILLFEARAARPPLRRLTATRPFQKIPSPFGRDIPKGEKKNER